MTSAVCHVKLSWALFYFTGTLWCITGTLQCITGALHYIFQYIIIVWCL